jgi:hypothetical protein
LNIKWYDADAPGGNVLAPGFPLVDGATYFAAQSSGNCESDLRTAVTVAIQDMVLPAPAILPNPQSLCGPATIADIIIPTGINNVVWYNASTGGTQYASIDPLTTGTYYAAIRVGNCESTTRTAVVINIVPSVILGGPSVVGYTPQNFCPGATVADIALPNNQMAIYATTTSPSPLLPETVLTTGTYYVVQMAGTCQSVGFASIIVNVGTPSAPVAPTPQTFCISATVANLSATGAGLVWYDSNTATEPLAWDESLVTGDYYVGSNVCGGPRTKVEVKVLTDGLTPPSAISPQVFCSGAFVSNLQAVGTGIKWYNTATGGTALLSGDALASGLYYAAQSTGSCESTTRTPVNVVIDDNLILNPPAITTPQRLCPTATLADVAIPTGINPANIKWYAAATGGSSLDPATVISVSATYYAATTAGSCESTGRTAVAITIGSTPPAVPLIDAPQHFCLGAMISNIVVPNNQIRWYAALTGGSQLASNTILASGTYFATQGGGGCESAPRLPIQIVIGNSMDTPDVPANLSVCGSGMLADLNINGIGILWFENETDNTPLPLSTVLTGTKTYYVAQSSGACESVKVPVIVTVHPNTMAPVASTPQSFCGSGTLADLTVTGNNIKWYSNLTDVIDLPLTTPLVNGTTYYASQSSDACEGTLRTAVTAQIVANIVLDAPIITVDQSFCGSPTLADVATDGSNIKWYSAAIGGSELPLTTPLVNGQSYFAAKIAGTCQSANRAEVSVTISGAIPEAPIMTTPQGFCAGALIANLAVPNNQILWYAALNGGTALSPGTELQETTYYAAQRAGDCESAVREPVVVTFGSLSAPVAQGGFCLNNMSGLTLLNIPVTGSGIVWYATATSTTQLDPALTALVGGQTYYAAQTSATCESPRTAVTIYDNCPTIRGTMFPFVHIPSAGAFNDLFPVIVKLTSVPSQCSGNPIGSALRYPVLRSENAVYYDGTTPLAGTPKNPGIIGALNNPGELLRWRDKLNKTPGVVDNTPVTGNEVPSNPVGLFTFENVAPGNYLLHITRKGFVSRFVKVRVTTTGWETLDPAAPTGWRNLANSSHWELVAGDVDGNLMVDMVDMSSMKTKISNYGAPNYLPWYDLNADARVNVARDMQLTLFTQGADAEIYQEVYDWYMWNFDPSCP